jgi:CDGSH-type Zn-finger protein
MDPKKPYIITETKGTKYYCACGRSQKMPYCDGAHKGSGLHPDKVEIEEEKTVAICSCRSSANLPFCDGTHNALQ